jgi:two-component sensor histidine kinase
MTGEHPARECRDTFLGRLDALIAAQELSYSGDGAATVQMLAERALTPFGDQAQVQAGAIAVLSEQQIMPLSLILHELAVNAAKYGAASVPDGVIRVSWEIDDKGDDKMLSLRWREENGPRVVAPSRSGFGSRLIDLSARGELGGAAELRHDPDGLRAVIKFPVN